MTRRGGGGGEGGVKEGEGEREGVRDREVYIHSENMQ